MRETLLSSHNTRQSSRQQHSVPAQIEHTSAVLLERTMPCGVSLVLGLLGVVWFPYPMRTPAGQHRHTYKKRNWLERYLQRVNILVLKASQQIDQPGSTPHLSTSNNLFWHVSKGPALANPSRIQKHQHAEDLHQYLTSVVNHFGTYLLVHFSAIDHGIR